MFERQPDDPIKVLARVTEAFPLGLGEGHPAWHSDGVLFALTARKLIKPVRVCADGSLVYKSTELGEKAIQAAQLRQGN